MKKLSYSIIVPVFNRPNEIDELYEVIDGLEKEKKDLEEKLEKLEKQEKVEKIEEVEKVIIDPKKEFVDLIEDIKNFISNSGGLSS